VLREINIKKSDANDQIAERDKTNNYDFNNFKNRKIYAALRDLLKLLHFIEFYLKKQKTKSSRIV